MTIAKPTQVATPFANSGLKNSIPQSATGSNLASLEEGFPAVTMAAVADGGTPPQGQDFNGILNQVTNQLRYAQAGGLYPYDSTFCTAIGGYPLGAILMSADGSKVWQNQVSGNTNNPDSDSTNWTELCTVDALTAGLATKQGTLTFDSTPTTNSSNPVTSDGVKTALDGKLSLTGGMMTGALQSNISYGAVISNWQGNPIVGIGGSSDQTFLSCPDGTKYLRVGDDGTATWAGKELERIAEISISNYEGYIRYSGGLQMCWGSATRSGSAGDVTVTFPKAFSTVPICQVSRSASANTTGGADEIFLRSVSTTSTNIYFPIGTNARWFAIGAWS